MHPGIKTVGDLITSAYPAFSRHRSVGENDVFVSCRQGSTPGSAEPPAIAVGHSQFPEAFAVIVYERFAVLGNEGVEIDESAYPAWHPVGHLARDDATVGMDDLAKGPPKS
jgi:hypothetical protein